MLKINNIEVIYSDVILVLRGVSMEIREGQVVALLGANGAGKTTTLKAVSGLLHSQDGEITRGNIEFNGQQIDHLRPDEIVRLGIIQVMEGHRMFDHLTVEENLQVGALARPSSPQIRKDIQRVYHYFPPLKKLRHNVSGYLSGGEKQMLVIGRGLMARPKLMLLDEPSLGLAPLLVEEIFRVVRQINQEEGVTFLLVEQNAHHALNVASYGYVMENGRVVLDGPSEHLKENEDVKEFYLGLTQVGERKSYRDIKHYKRRKRWLG
ncbi:MAG: ABC transporter ATP-binding protein [Anaerolineales bacterium]|jgi:branched-chain amino acid transport system ATP-binding protein